MGAPELPFGQPADERPELVVTRGGKGARLLSALFNLVREEVVLEGGVEAGLEEGEEEVEEVNRVGVLGETSVWRVVAGTIYDIHTAHCSTPCQQRTST